MVKYLFLAIFPERVPLVTPFLFTFLVVFLAGAFLAGAFLAGAFLVVFFSRSFFSSFFTHNIYSSHKFFIKSKNRVAYLSL